METDGFPFTSRRKVAPYLFIDLVIGQHTVSICHNKQKISYSFAINEISRPSLVILLLARFISRPGSDIIGSSRSSNFSKSGWRDKKDKISSKAELSRSVSSNIMIRLIVSPSFLNLAVVFMCNRYYANWLLYRAEYFPFLSINSS